MKMTQKNPILFLLLCLASQLSHAFLLSPSDTLKITMLGTAIIKSKSPFIVEFNKQAGVSFSSRHAIHRNAYVYMSVNGVRKEGIPFLDEGYVTVRRNGYSASGGVLKKEFGKCRIFKSTTLYDPKMEKVVLWDVFGKCRIYKSATRYDPLAGNWVLWDAEGLGFSFEKQLNRIGIHGAYTLDPERNKAFFLLGKVTHKGLQAGILWGMQSSDDGTRDDHMITGAEIFLDNRFLFLHTVCKYDYTTRFYYNDAEPLYTGRLFAGYIEARMRVLPFADMNVLAFYKNYSDPINTKSLYAGFICELMLNKFFGIGYGFERLEKNREAATSPEIFITLKPIKDHTAIKLSFKNRKKEEFLGPGKWSGSVWFEL